MGHFTYPVLSLYLCCVFFFSILLSTPNHRTFAGNKRKKDVSFGSCHEECQTLQGKKTDLSSNQLQVLDCSRIDMVLELSIKGANWVRGNRHVTVPQGREVAPSKEVQDFFFCNAVFFIEISALQKLLHLL